MMNNAPSCMYSVATILSRMNGHAAVQAEIFDSQVQFLSDRIKRIEKLKSDKQNELSCSIANMKKVENITSYTRDFMSLSALAAGAYTIKEEGASLGAVAAVAAGVTAIASRIGKATGVFESLSKPSKPEEVVASRLEEGNRWFGNLSSMFTLENVLDKSSQFLTLAGSSVLGGYSSAINTGTSLASIGLDYYRDSTQKDAAHHKSFINEKSSEVTMLYQDMFQTGQTALRIVKSQETLSAIAKQCAEALKIED